MSDSSTPPRTFLNCTWSELQVVSGGPLWIAVPHSRWCCLALSDEQGRLVPVQPDRCATCAYWQLRAELRPRRA